MSEVPLCILESGTQPSSFWPLEFTVQGSDFGVWGLGFVVWGLGFRVHGFGRTVKRLTESCETLGVSAGRAFAGLLEGFGVRGVSCPLATGVPRS